ncbi:MAG: hypothetical protein P4L35_10830 [Ignavibacteriaceae bacterium]|nr:hypothetical protein [Ignavibacteriaceae bacterium]
MASDKQQLNKIIYAGTVYEVKFKGERVMHLRSLKNKKFIVHVPVHSSLLEEYKSKEDGNEYKFSST